MLYSHTFSYYCIKGFPDYDPPSFVLNSLPLSVSHQYTRPAGYPQLVKLLAERYSKHLNREINPMDEVAVTVGASQALYLTLTSLLKKGMIISRSHSRMHC